MSILGNILLAHRVARRFEAKGGLVLLPEYKKALESLTKADPKEMLEFGEKVQKVIAPTGSKPAEWVWGLGTSKRNALNSLYKEITLFKGDAEQDSRDPVMLSYLVKRCTDWAKNIRTLELAAQADEEPSEVPHGPFTVVPMPGITKTQLDLVLKALDEASSKLRPKFPQVLYGKVYLATHLKSGVGAWYPENEDKLYIAVNVFGQKGFDVYAIIHELGHRFDYKFVDAALRREFTNLSTQKIYAKVQFDSKLREEVADELVLFVKAQVQGKTLPTLSDNAVLWVTHLTDPKKITADFVDGKIDERELHTKFKGKEDAELGTGKILHGPLTVSAYGAKSVRENFAEAFAHYVLGKPLAPEFTRLFDQMS